MRQLPVEVEAAEEVVVFLVAVEVEAVSPEAVPPRVAAFRPGRDELAQ
jgi:hypothetical protein